MSLPLTDPMPPLFIPPDAEPGMLEYAVERSLDDYCARYGFEATRALAAEALIRLANSQHPKRKEAA